MQLPRGVLCRLRTANKWSLDGLASIIVGSVPIVVSAVFGVLENVEFGWARADHVIRAVLPCEPFPSTTTAISG